MKCKITLINGLQIAVNVDYDAVREQLRHCFVNADPVMEVMGYEYPTLGVPIPRRMLIYVTAIASIHEMV